MVAGRTALAFGFLSSAVECVEDRVLDKPIGWSKRWDVKPERGGKPDEPGNAHPRKQSALEQGDGALVDERPVFELELRPVMCQPRAASRPSEELERRPVAGRLIGRAEWHR
jgi:hypothetical protein